MNKAICILLLCGTSWAYENANTRRHPVQDNIDFEFLVLWHLDVNLTDSDPIALLAASVATGLLNRKQYNDRSVISYAPSHKFLVEDAVTNDPSLAGSFLAEASFEILIQVAISTGAIYSSVLYDPAEPWTLPTVITLCGLHNALPIPIRPKSDSLLRYSTVSSSRSDQVSEIYLSLASRKLDVAHSTVGRWKNSQAATAWALSNLLPITQTLSTNTLGVLSPAIIQTGLLVDYLVQRKLLTIYGDDLCNKASPQNALLVEAFNRIGEQGPAVLTQVIGYFPGQEVLQECGPAQMAEISLVADKAPSLSFWSTLTTPIPTLQPPVQATAYNPNITYVAVINSDGDNLQLAFNSLDPQMNDRAQYCAGQASMNLTCPPLSWTLSNRLQEFGPSLLSSFYERAWLTGQDSFLMGPTGYGFLHPSNLPSDSPRLSAFFNKTIEAATRLDMSSFVWWDNDGTVIHSPEGRSTHSSTQLRGSGGLQQELEKGKRFTATPRTSHDSLTVLSSRVRRLLADMDTPPHNPRGAAFSREGIASRFSFSAIKGIFSPFLNVQSAERLESLALIPEVFRWFEEDEMDALVTKLGELPRGTISYVYKIHLLPMEVFHALPGKLPDHVQLVGHRELIDLAHQSFV